MSNTRNPNRAKKTLVALGLSAGLIGGGAAGAILGTPGLSGAQDDTTTTVAPDASTEQTDGERPDISQHFADALAPLVESGTITQAQADAVVAALAEAGPPEGGRGGHGGRHGGPGLDAAATAIGISADELRTALQDGQTIAQVAESKGVDVQTVIDAMVAEFKAHLDEEVASGEHTQEEADQKLADVTERITDSVNNGMPERGEARQGD